MIEHSEIIIRLILSVIFGGLIGLERELVHRPAGIRTHMLVSLGSALFILITLETIPTEIARIVAGIATGIGFLGAGTIFKAQNEVHGLTTAASIWAVAGVGMCVGLGLYFMTTVSVLLILVVLQLHRGDFLKRL